jgi:hypothetical protein
MPGSDCPGVHYVSGCALLLRIGALIVMGHETVQTSCTVKEIMPRLVVGFAAANLFLILI